MLKRKRKTKRKFVPTDVLRIIGWIAADRVRGIVAAVAIAAPLTWVVMEQAYDELDRRLASALVAESEQRAPKPMSSPGIRNVVVERNVGEPFLLHQPLPEGAVEPVWKTGEIRSAEQLVKYLVFKRPADKDIYEQLVLEKKQSCEQASESQAATTKVGHYRTSRGEYATYGVLCEVVLVTMAGGERHIVLDVGVQQSPGEWIRLPWWSTEGASLSNSLLSMTRDSWVPAVRIISCPTTTDSFAVWMTQSFSKFADATNSDYRSAGSLKLSSEELTRGVVHTIEELIATDVGNLNNRSDVMALCLFGGFLQWLMVHALLAFFLASAARWVMYIAVDRRYARRLQSATAPERQLPVAVLRRYVELLRNRHHRLFDVPSLVLESAHAGWSTTRPRFAAVRAEADYQAAQRLVRNRSAGEWAAQLNFYGMIGSLFFIAISISVLRLHPNPGVTGASLTTLAVTMGQAFWTTILSSTLCRVVLWSGVLQGASEDAVRDEWQRIAERCTRS